MSTQYEDIKETLDSAGMKHIVRAFRSYHKSQWRALRDCSPERVREIQAVMKAIDTAMPLVLENLLNKHLDAKKESDRSIWFIFADWVKKFRYH
jgi:hypothetical protein